MSKLDDIINGLCDDELDDILERIFEKEERMIAFTSRWVERYHRLPFEKRTELLEKAIAKYDSDGYKDRWYHRGIEPPTPLLGLFYCYAQKHGTMLEEDDLWLDSCFMVDGYKVKCYCGQGVFYQVEKI